MKDITLLCVGLLKRGLEFDLFHRYNDRLFSKIRLIEYKTIAEVERFLTTSKATGIIILLDEGGKNISTMELSAFLSQNTRVTFVIGAHDGFTDALYAKAHHTWSFGRLTLPHLLVRGVLAEQVYRAQQIQNNHPYHRG